MAGVHLEGMGIVGCYLAHRLHRDGVPFTWSDTDELVNAWQASTGAIFPTGHAEDMEALAVWRTHLDDPGFAPFLEQAAYVFSTKNPPHQGRYPYLQLAGCDMRVAEERSLHLNAQRWVPATRIRFAAFRRKHATSTEQVVVTHGFGPRLMRFMWGWTVPVRLSVDPGLRGYAVEDGRKVRELRPSIYCREGRFVMAYAYPVPLTDTWYAGSSLISQRVARRLDVEAKFRRWREQFLAMTDGYVTGVVRAGKPLEGWRPVPAARDTEWVTRQPDGSLAARPLWHSGIRHAPHIYNALQEVL